MGASMALWLAARVPDDVAATAVYYGGQDIDMEDARCAFLGHYAETDPYVDEDGLVLLESELHLDGLEVEFHRYPGTRHWFAEPDRPEHDHHAAALAWDRTLDFFESATCPGARSARCSSARAAASRAARKVATRSPSCSGLAPSSRSRMSAEATTTPSACAAAATAWSGVAMPKPMTTGRSVVALSRLASTVDELGQLGALAGDAEQVHAVDEALRPLAQHGEPIVGGERRGELHGGEADGVAVGLPLPHLLHREVRQDHAGELRGHGLRGEALVAGVEHEVHVGHGDQRHAGVDVAQRGEDRGEVGALRRAPPPRPPGSWGRPSPGRRTGCRPRWRRRRRPRRPARPRSSRRPARR